MDFFGLAEQLADSEDQAGRAGPAQRRDVLATLAWYLRQRDPKRALALADEADALPRCEPSTSGRLLLVRAELAALAGNIEAAQQQLAQARECFAEHGDFIGTGDAGLIEITILATLGRVRERRGVLEAAAEAYRTAGGELRCKLARLVIARDAAYFDAAAAAAQWSSLVDEALELGHPGLATYAEWFKSQQLMQSGQWADAAKHLIRAGELAQAAGATIAAILSTANVSIMYYNAGDQEGCLHWAHRAVTLARPMGWPSMLAQTLNVLSSPLRELCNYDMARAVLHESLTVLAPFPGGQPASQAHGYLGELYCKIEDHEKALHHLDEAVRITRELGFIDLGKYLSHKARSLAATGRRDEALAAAQEAIEFSRRRGNAAREADGLQAMAEVARRFGLPAPEGSSAPSGAIHWMEESMRVSTSFQGYVSDDSIFTEISRDHEAAGNLALALQYERRAVEIREKARTKKATDLATAFQVRFETERALAEAAHQRSLAAVEAQRAQGLQEAIKDLERLAEIGQEITASIDAHTVFRALHRHVDALIDAPSLAIWLIEGQELVLRFGMEEGQPLPGLRVSLDNAASNAARSARERCEVLVEFGPQEQVAPHIPGTREMLTALFAPLMSGGQLHGVLSIQSAKEKAYGERERQIFRTLCAYGAVALANAASARRLAEAQTELEHEKMRNVLVHAGKMVTIGRLASGVVHEMAHPVGTVTLLNETAQGLIALDRTEEAASLLKKIERETDRLQGLIGRLRHFARSDPPIVVATDLRSVLADAKVLFMPRLRLEQVTYEETVDPVPVQADNERLGLVVANIVFNAMEAMRGTACRRIELSSGVDADWVLLTVRDTGPGLAPEIREQLFQPFFTTKPPGSGLGLGLSLSAESMASMKGRIVAGNHAQGGAVFTIMLPRVAERGQAS